jgi:hypothetical protein
MLSGSTIDVKLLQPWNTNAPIVVTPEGIVIDVKPAQPLNA